MQGWKLAAWWTGVIAYICAVWVVHLFSFEDLSGQSAAAWVQAVGSVLAILAAVAVAAFQHSRDVYREELKAREELRRVVGVLQTCARELKAIFTEQFALQEYGPRGSKDIGKATMRIDLVHGALSSFVPSQMPSADLHLLLHNLLMAVAVVNRSIEKNQTLERNFTAVNWAATWNDHIERVDSLCWRLDHQMALIDNPGARRPFF